MPDAHDLAFPRPGSRYQLGRQRVGLDHQGVVAGNRQWVPQSGENAPFVVPDLRALPVHRRGGVLDPSAKGGTDRLVAKTYSENRDVVAQPPDQVDRDTCVGRITGARRDNDQIGSEAGDLFDGHLVVAVHDTLGAKLSHVLHEVVDERVVVVDDADHAAAGSAIFRSALGSQARSDPQGKNWPDRRSTCTCRPTWKSGNRRAGSCSH